MSFARIDHSEFEELCAAYVAGSLTAAEQLPLARHLAGCVRCRQTLEKFQEDVCAIAVASAPRLVSSSLNAEFSWNSDSVKSRVLARIPQDLPDEHPEPGATTVEIVKAREAGIRVNRFAKTLRMALPYAAGFALATGLSIALYWVGPRKIAGAFRLNATRAEIDASLWRQKAADVSKERDALNAQLQQALANVGRSAAGLTTLQDESAQQRREIEALRASDLKAAEEKRQLAASQAQLSSSLQEAQAALATTRNQLASAGQQRTGDILKTTDLEKRVADLSALVKEQGETIEQQRELLASDRDIRELMGARNLYVAEVYDAELNGRPKRPFARVFFTKDKSLIFYGFDLDEQPGVKEASTFQAWGRRGPSRSQALSLGILYQETSSNKKWVLKIDDPEKLKAIDAVFVTIEPKGGSREPSGHALLFAYLRVDPNHP